MPGRAPRSPATQLPSVLLTLPCSYSLVSSPKYQTVPVRSWAYQSSVSSFRAPSSRTVSRTSTHSTPAMVRVRLVTVTTVVSTPSFVADRYCQRMPDRNGKNGLSTVLPNAAGSMDGACGPVTGAADPGRAGVLDVTAATLGLAGGVPLRQAARAAAAVPIRIQHVARVITASLAPSMPRGR